MDDPMDLTDADAKQFGDLSQEHRPVHVSDGDRVIHREYDVLGEAHIFGVRHRRQVLGVDARLVLAPMVKFRPAGDCPVDPLPVRDVGGFLGLPVSPADAGVPAPENDVQFPTRRGEPAIDDSVSVGFSPLVIEDESPGLSLDPTTTAVGARGKGRGQSAPTLTQFCGIVGVRHLVTSVIGPGYVAPGASKPPGTSLPAFYHEDR